MEIIILILLVVVVLLLVQQKSTLISSIQQLELKIIRLHELIKELQVEKPAAPSMPMPMPTPAPEPVEPAPVVIQHPITPVEPILVQEEVEPEEIPVVPVIPAPVIPSIPEYKDTSYSTKPPVWKEEPSLSFFERHPDLEKFIGENLVNKIGIAILVLSIGYFVKYAIDSNWVGEIGRVAIGLLCGGILIGFAHRMRNSYNAFSSVLVGGGLAVFYFTITLAFHQFHLFNQLTAFMILIVITLFAVALSLLYDKQELAVIALVGGFVSPFMLSTGTQNYNGLFLYLVILNVGLLIIAYYKQWRILNITAFGLTIIVFAAVLFRLTVTTYYLGFIYATIFYFLYLGINIAYNIREGKRFLASDFSILLINTGLYFSVGLYVLSEMGYGQYRGLYSAVLGVLNLVLSYVLFRNKKVDTNVLYLLIGITLTFVSLTAPIQLNGNHITIFWASEAVVLYWLYIKSGIKLTRLSALLIWCLMVISLLMDWSNVYSFNDLLPIIFNKGFITSLFAAITTYVLGILVAKDEQPQFVFHIPRHLFQMSAVVILFIGGLLEVNHQFSHAGHLNSLYLMLYVAAYMLILVLISGKIPSINIIWPIRLAILVAPVAMFFSAYPYFSFAQRAVIEQDLFSGGHFVAQYVSAILVGVIFYKIIGLIRTHLEPGFLTASSWLVCSAIVLFLSLELNLINNAIFGSITHPIDQIQSVYVKTGLPVLWGVLSFAMMWLGMNYKYRTLRIISLSLFTLTLIKLFLFDIRNIPAAGKIVAFFCLGILLLIVSFMYQKVKKIIVADEEVKND